MKYSEYPPQEALARVGLCTDLPIINRLLQTAASNNNVSAVIAGGAVRDAVVGLWPNDIDVFVDTAGLFPEEAEDCLALVADEVTRKMAVLYQLPEDNVIGDLARARFFRKDSTAYAGADLSEFVVYEAYYHEMWDTNPTDLALNYKVGAPVQFIGRPFTFVKELIDDFDYGLVRAWVDPETGNFQFDPTFDAELAKKTISISGPKAWDRVNQFNSRLTRQNMFKYTGYSPYTATMEKARATYANQTRKTFVMQNWGDDIGALLPDDELLAGVDDPADWLAPPEDNNDVNLF